MLKPTNLYSNACLDVFQNAFQGHWRYFLVTKRYENGSPSEGRPTELLFATQVAAEGRTFNQIAASNMTKSAGTPFFSAPEKWGEKGKQIGPK